MNDAGTVLQLTWIARLVVLLAVACVGCTSLEDQRFYSTFDAIPIGMTEAELLTRLGPPQDAGTKFYLGQPAGFEKQYQEAAESSSIRFVFWHREVDVICAVGLDAQDRVAYKACGGT